MFKVKEIKTGKILQVLDTHCDEYGKAWFLFWVGEKWGWRPADNYCPPNYIPKKKIIVAGSRTFCDYHKVREALDKRKDEIKEIVCGGARGADSLGETYAISHDIKVTYFNADWQNDGQAAGFIRNHKMGDYADELIAFWDGKSTGTKDMIEYMQKLKKPIEIINF